VILNFSKSSIVIENKEHLLLLFERSGFRNLHDSVGYVGAEACKQCHADMYELYMRTGMGQSWGLANKAKSASVFKAGHPLYDEKSGFYYQPFWDGDVMKVLEFKMENGDTVFKRIEKISYIVGSGQHTNSHILSINGYLYQVPFTYYTQIGLLDFPPGFEGGNNARFSRMIGAECISCHNSYPNQVGSSINKYDEVPLGINCERCHGPGELHVKTMEAGMVVNTELQPDFTIVNPKRLTAKLQFQLCLRCHSQGNSVLKDGKGFYDYKPAMYVSEIVDVFREVYENDDDAFWMETHPERLMKSKCFSKSQNHPDFEPLTCLTCHFTSSLKHTSYKETPRDTFNGICKNCHLQKYQLLCKENEGERMNHADDCVLCHLPKSGTFDIPHVIISDHFIRVNDKWKQPIKSTNEIETGKFLRLKCMTNDHPDDLSIARAHIYHYEKFMTLPALLDTASVYLSKFPEKSVYSDWIYFYYLKQDYEKIIQLAKKYHDENSSNAMLHYQTGQSYYNLDKYEKAIEYYQFAVEHQPYILDYRNKLGTAYMNVRYMVRARKEFEFMLAENPQSAMALNNLGFIFLLENDFRKARDYFMKALKYDPDYMNAHLNIIKTYLGQSDLVSARAYLSRLAVRYPEDRQIQQFQELFKNRP